MICRLYLLGEVLGMIIPAHTNNNTAHLVVHFSQFRLSKQIIQCFVYYDGAKRQRSFLAFLEVRKVQLYTISGNIPRKSAAFYDRYL